MRVRRHPDLHGEFHRVVHTKQIGVRARLLACPALPKQFGYFQESFVKKGVHVGPSQGGGESALAVFGSGVYVGVSSEKCLHGVHVAPVCCQDERGRAIVVCGIHVGAGREQRFDVIGSGGPNGVH